jgi:hypothetical protein
MPTTAAGDGPHACWQNHVGIPGPNSTRHVDPLCARSKSSRDSPVQPANNVNTISARVMRAP